MAQTNLSVRVNELDKKNFELFCNETGMNVSVAINMFIKTVLRERRLPFEIKIDPFYSKSNIEYLEKTYGWKKVLQLIKTENYSDVFGKDRKEIYREWVKFVENYYQ